MSHMFLSSKEENIWFRNVLLVITYIYEKIEIATDRSYLTETLRFVLPWLFHVLNEKLNSFNFRNNKLRLLTQG